MLTEQVISIIVETGHLEDETVTVDSTFEELGLDSMDGIEIVCRLEEELDIEIPNQVVRVVKTVRDVIEAIEAQQAVGAPEL